VAPSQPISQISISVTAIFPAGWLHHSQSPISLGGSITAKFLLWWLRHNQFPNFPFPSGGSIIAILISYPSTLDGLASISSPHICLRIHIVPQFVCVRCILYVCVFVSLFVCIL